MEQPKGEPKDPVKDAKVQPKKEQKTYSFKWQDAPWRDVINWLVNITELPLIGDIQVTGSFTFSPPLVDGKEKKYTVPDIIDVIDRKSTRLNSSHDQISYAV